MWSWLFLCSFGLFWCHNSKSLPFSSLTFDGPQWKEMLLQAAGSVCMLGWLDWDSGEVGEGCEVCRCQCFKKCSASWLRDPSELMKRGPPRVLHFSRQGGLSSGEKRVLPVVDLAWVLDILHLYFHKIYTFLVLRPSYEAGRRTHLCQLHVTAWRDSLVSKSTENSPQRWTCWLLEGVFVATELRKALSSLLLSSTSTCPYPRLQSDHWRMPASCYSHFSGPHVGSMKTVTDQRL